MSQYRSLDADEYANSATGVCQRGISSGKMSSFSHKYLKTINAAKSQSRQTGH